MTSSGRQLALHMASRALPWAGMLIVVSSITYGLQLFATALAPKASAVSVTQATIGHIEGNATLLDRASFEQGSSQPDGAAWSSPKRVVTITGRDAMTGERQQVQCTIDANRAGRDTVVVDLKDFGDAVWGLCQ